LLLPEFSVAPMTKTWLVKITSSIWLTEFVVVTAKLSYRYPVDLVTLIVCDDVDASSLFKFFSGSGVKHDTSMLNSNTISFCDGDKN
jgi:hypothetical protein